MEKQISYDLYNISEEELKKLSDIEVVSFFNIDLFSFIELQKNEFLYKRLNSIIWFEIRLEPLEWLKKVTRELILSLLNEKVSDKGSKIA